jgi:hypothetical protein
LRSEHVARHPGQPDVDHQHADVMLLKQPKRLFGIGTWLPLNAGAALRHLLDVRAQRGVERLALRTH